MTALAPQEIPETTSPDIYKMKFEHVPDTKFQYPHLQPDSFSGIQFEANYRIIDNQVIGTDASRYFGIDLEYFRNRMDAETFSIFIDFIGEEEIGLAQEDVEEVYHPEE